MMLIVAALAMSQGAAVKVSVADFQQRYDEFCTKLRRADPSLVQMAVPSFTYTGPHGLTLDYDKWASGFEAACKFNIAILVRADVKSVRQRGDDYLVEYRWHYRCRNGHQGQALRDTYSRSVDTWRSINGQMRLVQGCDLWIINTVDGIPTGLKGPAA